MARNQTDNFKPWSWDACRKRLMDLKATNDHVAAVEFWARIDKLVGQARNKIEQAMLEESRDRLNDLWDNLGMQEWYLEVKEKGSEKEGEKSEAIEWGEDEAGGFEPAF